MKTLQFRRILSVVDVEILRAVSDDPTLSIAEIAKLLQRNRWGIYKRVQRLELLLLLFWSSGRWHLHLYRLEWWPSRVNVNVRAGVVTCRPVPGLRSVTWAEYLAAADLGLDPESAEFWADF